MPRSPEHGSPAGDRNYNFRMETDAAVIQTVREVRSSIDATLERSRREHLGSVLCGPDGGPAWVVKTLDVHPCMGKVAGRRVLRELGIEERTRLADLTQAQREQLSGRCRCVRA